LSSTSTGYVNSFTSLAQAQNRKVVRRVGLWSAAADFSEWNLSEAHQLYAALLTDVWTAGGPKCRCNAHPISTSSSWRQAVVAQLTRKSSNSPTRHCSCCCCCCGGGGCYGILTDNWRRYNAPGGNGVLLDQIYRRSWLCCYASRNYLLRSCCCCQLSFSHRSSVYACSEK